MWIGRNVGLGQDVTGDLTSWTAGTDSATGLPILVELGIGLLGTILLVRLAGRSRKRYKSYSRKRSQTQARRAALKAELAAL